MAEIMSGLHFLRPVWLIGVVVSPLLVWLVWRRVQGGDPWRRICDGHLLPYLRLSRAGDGGAVRFASIALLGVLAALALAGPSWNAAEVPMYRALRARVVVLDLSRSMDAFDVAPSRLALARAKASTLLERSREVQAGLVVFAGDAFAVTPLTSDTETLIAILPAFDTSVMPEQGSRPDLGLKEAAELLRGAGVSQGDIVLISDGAKGRHAVDAAGALHERGFRVSVLAVGTASGGEIPIAAGGSLRSLDGEVVVAKTPLGLMREIATAGGGHFGVATGSDQDIATLLEALEPDGAPHDFETTTHRARVWLDRGPWIVLAMLPLAAVGMRRGWIVALACVCIMPAPRSMAGSGDDFGGLQALPEPEASSTEGAGAWKDRSGWRWRGVTLYREGRYLEAAEVFARGDDADDHYNRGNALAKAGLLRAAVAAYGEALARESIHEDARFNHRLVARLLGRQAPPPQRGESRRGGERSQASDRSERGQPRLRQPPAAGSEPLPQPSPFDEDTPRATDSAGSGRGLQAGEFGRDRPQAESFGDARSAVGRPTGSELKAMEGALNRIVEDRLTLWRRKIELKWRNRSRKLPALSDAW